MSNTVPDPLITIDGDFSDWVQSELIDNPGNFVPDYDIYGTVQDDTYYIAIKSTGGSNPVIGAGTTIWLNTDQDAATGYSPFDNIGADYNVTYVNGAFYLYTGAAGQNLVSTTPLTTALSPDGTSLEVAVPRSLLTQAGSAAPTNINVDAQIDTGTSSAVYLPGDYNNPQYTITDPATLPPQPSTRKVAIVYSDTSANLYFSQTAYSDLFMAAQNQARMAGVSYDIIDESQLTDINNLTGYSELIFPSMPDVNTAQLPAILSTLTSAVYNYHIGIITAGDFLTNDQTGAPLAGNSYANMQTLLGLERYTGGNAGDVTVTANDVSNPIMQGYSAGQTIQTYANEGYAVYQGVNTATDVLVNQNVAGVGTLPGVVQTTTGGTNVHFATTDLEGDSNLLSNAIQSAVVGTAPGVVLHTSRDAGIVVARMDMDQSQYTSDTSPANGGPGIYDVLLPILQQWNQQYGFVGSYYINIGDDPTGDSPTITDWSKALPFYKALQAMGGEIGNHSYTHLINPPTQMFTATTVGDTPAGSTNIVLNAVPSFAGSTIGMQVTGAGLGTNTPLPGGAGEGGSIANTTITGVSDDTISVSYAPGGYGTPNDGTLADIPAGTTLTFIIPSENTNFLQSGTNAVVSGTGNPFTFDYEFNQSKLLESQMLGTPIYGAAIPGANETYVTDQNILPYYQSVAPTATTPGYTGYLSGGWTGIGSGYPGAIGYMNPSDTGAVYIAPNMTFDFTETQYEGKSIAQTEADWAAQFAALGANAAGTPVVVWPIHDYGAAAWDTNTGMTTGDTPTAEQPFTTAMYTDFIKLAYDSNYEFITAEELAARVAAQQKATINYTTVGNTITATVTPDPTAPDLGAMALDVVNGGTNVIENVTNWYAYNASELFLPDNGGSFTINLGPTQDDVTHITSLPMRADLLSVTGDGLNLDFSMTGVGDVLIDLGNTAGYVLQVVGATISSLVNGILDLTLSGTGIENVSVLFTQQPPTEVVSAVQFSADTGASATDFITQTAAQTITGVLGAPLAAGDVVKISLDNGVTWLTATAATGDTTFSLAGVTLTGSGTLIAEVQNASGTASAQLTQAYVLDQTPPTEIATIVSMTNDSGVAGDFITNNGAAGRVVTGTLSAALGTDETLQISNDGGTSWAGATVTGTTWTETDSSAHAANWAIQARVIDLAGNTGSIASQAVTYDTTPPAVLSVPMLTTASDSGVSSTDGITNVTVPTFMGAGAEAGSTVTLRDGTVAIGSGVAATDGSWTITSTATLANGVHQITTTDTDLAGNISAASAAMSVMIDTIAPVAPAAPDLTAASDSGKSSTDNITNVTTPTFTRTAPANTQVVLYDGATVIGSAMSSATGAWSITSSQLQPGVHSITAKTMDAAGNYSVASPALSVTIETAAAAPSAPQLAAASNSGVTTDNITKVNTPTFTGTAPAGSAVTLLDGTTVIGTATATVAGAWTIKSSLLANGTHNISATEKDATGNISASSPVVAVTIDTAAPPAPTTPVLSAASDSGVSNSDDITNVTTPTFTGTAEAGSTVTLYNGTAKVGTGVADTNGAWAITSSTLGAGTHLISAKATDVAGNIGASSGMLSINIETKIAKPGAPMLLSSSDTGVSMTDRLTNDVTPTFMGTAAPGSIVTLYDGTSVVGTVSTSTLGTWSITSSSLADGVHSMTVKATDVAGNLSVASAALAVTVDTQAPAAPAFKSGTLTSLTGTGEAGDTVKLLNGTATVATATVGGAGNWNMSFITGSAPRVLTAVETDRAGNTGVQSATQVLIGTSGADKLTATSSNNLLIGGGGADTFSFGASLGINVIADFTATGAAHDVINLHGNAVLNSFANVISHATAAGSSTVIGFDGNDSITLNNVPKTSLVAADFTFA